jgi:8-oxo-dGTP pyrophosphatase MutT (NUDIX family)
MLNEEWVDVIDRENRVIGQAPRALSYLKRLSHRIVHVMVVSDQCIYLVKRAEGVRYLAGFYCSSAGGHVHAGETSQAAALREMKEEIGLSGPLRLVSKFFFTHEFDVHVSLYVKEFRADHEQFVLNPAEVASGRFYSFDEIANLNRELFHPQMIPCLELVQNFLITKNGAE